MNTILDIPLGVRLAILFVLGAVVGCLLNWAIYGLGWQPRPLSPWSRDHPHDRVGRWIDRIPIIGWWSLWRKTGQLGRGFWIRPMLIEMTTGLLFAGLYWWEVNQKGLLPKPLPDGELGPAVLWSLHLQYASHLLLVSLMLVASFIDIDEQTIPDAVTVTGTLLGLLLAAACPWSALPENLGGFPILHVQGTHLFSPGTWPPRFAGFPDPWSLVIALGCFWLWCVALLPRPWRTRHGLRRACQLLIARVTREAVSLVILAMAVAGGLVIAAVWWYGWVHWIGLLSGLVGLAVGAGVVWATRILGSWALKREAMGFGDVTLMAMIGSFLGWQAVLVVYFLAPFAGLVIGLAQWAIHRENVLPYGPFLCLAALVVVVEWGPIWDHLFAFFAIGWLIPAVMVSCLISMAVLLGLWQVVRGLLVGG